MNHTVLITGGAGFIGSHLAERYLSLGWRVILLDDLSTGTVRNVRHLRDNPRLTCIVDSIMNTRLTAELVDEADLVIHLAAAVGVQLIVQRPVWTIETNVNGTETVLRAAQKKGRPCFIASTSEVYGKGTDLPFREDGDMVLGPTSRSRWAYACSKALDEFLALAQAREHGLPVVIGRLFNTTGPRQAGRYGMVMPRFVGQALAGEPITVYGDGSQRRCFTHVDDVVSAIVALMETPSAYGEVYNIGNDQEISILELAHRVKEQTGSPSEIVTIPYEEAYQEGFEDLERRIPSTEKLRAAIDWSPRRGLRDIIADVAASLREQVDLPGAPPTRPFSAPFTTPAR